MVYRFDLPDVGEGISEAEIVNWLVEEGDSVEEEDPILEVETDKAIVEITSPATGVVQEIHVEVGAVVKVGEVMISFDTDEDQEIGEVQFEEVSESDGGEKQSLVRDPTREEGSRVFASPSTRKLARELGVVLEEVDGSGVGGRITDEDVKQAAQSDNKEQGGEEGSDEAESDESLELLSEKRDKTLAMPNTRRLARELGVEIDRVPTDQTRNDDPFVTEEMVRAVAGETQEVAEDEGEEDEQKIEEEEVAADTEVSESIPYKGVRKRIGDKMTESFYTAPHVTHHDSMDATRLVEVKEEVKQEHSDVTYSAFIVKACANALREHLSLNASLDEENEEIIRHRDINIGVAADTDNGLRVPVVMNADEKSIPEISRDISRLADAAKNNEIKPEEMRNGTFTVSNIGSLGGEYATPIINYPEAAVLVTGSIEKRPWVVDDEVVARYVLPMSLSIDHRVVDGADAARFTNRVMELLGSPSLLLLE